MNIVEQTELEFLQDLNAAISQALEQKGEWGFIAVNIQPAWNAAWSTLKMLANEVRNRISELEDQSRRRVNIQRLAEAYIEVAKVNHYLVRVAPGYTLDELNRAEQILIRLDNDADNQDPVLNLALDILEHDRKALETSP